MQRLQQKRESEKQENADRFKREKKITKVGEKNNLLVKFQTIDDDSQVSYFNLSYFFV